MPFLLKKSRQEYIPHLPKTFNGLKIYSMKKQKVIRMSVSLYLEFEAPKLVKVKAFKRIRNGKVEIVRSHYRCVWGR